MLKEIRRIKNRAKRVRYYFLLTHNMLPKHTNEKGYICYDSEELKEYKKTHRRGRPSKKGE